MWRALDVAKKQHRERAQPHDRKKWGLLEKKKDYKLRAADYHRKQAHLALLRAKAERANEDEFNFGMIKARTKEGVLVASRGAETLSTDAVKLLKTQDAGYVRSLLGNEEAQILRAKQGLMLEGEGKHTVFVDNKQEFDEFAPEKYFDTDKGLVGRRSNRLRNAQLEGAPQATGLLPERDLKDLEQLSKRIDRQQELTKVRQKLDLQRELMKKGDKKKVVAKDGTVSYKWKKVRKR